MLVFLDASLARSTNRRNNEEKKETQGNKRNTGLDAQVADVERSQKPQDINAGMNCVFYGKEQRVMTSELMLFVPEKLLATAR